MKKIIFLGLLTVFFIGCGQKTLSGQDAVVPSEIEPTIIDTSVVTSGVNDGIIIKSQSKDNGLTYLNEAFNNSRTGCVKISEIVGKGFISDDISILDSKKVPKYFNSVFQVALTSDIDGDEFVENLRGYFFNNKSLNGLDDFCYLEDSSRYVTAFGPKGDPNVYHLLLSSNWKSFSDYVLLEDIGNKKIQFAPHVFDNYDLLKVFDENGWSFISVDVSNGIKKTLETCSFDGKNKKTDHFSCTTQYKPIDVGTLKSVAALPLPWEMDLSPSPKLKSNAPRGYVDPEVALLSESRDGSKIIKHFSGYFPNDWFPITYLFNVPKDDHSCQRISTLIDKNFNSYTSDLVDSDGFKQYLKSVSGKEGDGMDFASDFHEGFDGKIEGVDEVCSKSGKTYLTVYNKGWGENLLTRTDSGFRSLELTSSEGKSGGGPRFVPLAVDSKHLQISIDGEFGYYNWGAFLIDPDTDEKTLVEKCSSKPDYDVLDPKETRDGFTVTCDPEYKPERQ